MCNRHEILLAGALLAVMLAGEILIANPVNEYKKGYWYDEFLTCLIAGDPSPAHALQALRHGMDGMPIPYYCILRTAHWIVGGEAMPVYRACSTVAMWVALLAVYATLRSGLDPMAAAIAVLVFWGTPLMARYATEARPYAMILAGVACLAWGLRIGGRRGTVMVFLAAAFTCTIHYLGIVPVSLMLAAEFSLGPDSLSDRFRRVAPGIVGMTALLPLVPLMLAQHRGIGETWVAPLTLRGAEKMMRELYFYRTFSLVFLIWWLGRLLNLSDGRLESGAWRRLAPLFAMIGVPLVLMVYSMIGESLLVDRYFIATLLGMPVLMGLLLARANPAVKALLLVAFVIISMVAVRTNSERLKKLQKTYAKTAQDASGGNYSLVFQSSVNAWPIWFAYPQLQPRMALVDLSPGSWPPLPRNLAHMQHIERNTEQLYKLPPRWGVNQIANHGFFRLLSEGEYTPVLEKWTPLVLVDPQRGLYQMRR